MPGRRLSSVEREEISRGVAEGMAYAEIARALSRPTSTVSREVARNGGRCAYRAWRVSFASSMGPPRCHKQGTTLGATFGRRRMIPAPR